LFAHAERTAHDWLRVAADRLEIDDVQEAYRMLRSWLHLVRDRVTVNSAAHLAAQLPELLRGVFYDGWQPSKVPMRMHAEEFLLRFQQDARIPATEVRPALAAITSAMRELFSPGQLDTVIGQLPDDVWALLYPAPTGRAR
jgi:uncharacterized protein (DUF2267 family)